MRLHDLPESGDARGDLDGHVVELLRQNEFLEEANLVREQTGGGLKESRDKVLAIAKHRLLTVGLE